LNKQILILQQSEREGYCKVKLHLPIGKVIQLQKF